MDLITPPNISSTDAALHAAVCLLEQEEAKHAFLLNALEEGENSGESFKPLDAVIAEAKKRFNASSLHKI